MPLTEAFLLCSGFDFLTGLSLTAFLALQKEVTMVFPPILPAFTFCIFPKGPDFYQPTKGGSMSTR